MQSLLVISAYCLIASALSHNGHAGQPTTSSQHHQHQHGGAQTHGHGFGQGWGHRQPRKVASQMPGHLEHEPQHESASVTLRSKNDAKAEATIHLDRPKRYTSYSSSYSYQRRTCISDQNGRMHCTEQSGTDTSPPSTSMLTGSIYGRSSGGDLTGGYGSNGIRGTETFGRPSGWERMGDRPYWRGGAEGRGVPSGYSDLSGRTVPDTRYDGYGYSDGTADTNLGRKQPNGYGDIGGRAKPGGYDTTGGRSQTWGSGSAGSRQSLGYDSYSGQHPSKWGKTNGGRGEAPSGYDSTAGNSVSYGAPRGADYADTGFRTVPPGRDISGRGSLPSKYDSWAGGEATQPSTWDSSSTDRTQQPFSWEYTTIAPTKTADWSSDSTGAVAPASLDDLDSRDEDTGVADTASGTLIKLKTDSDQTGDWVRPSAAQATQSYGNGRGRDGFSGGLTSDGGYGRPGISEEGGYRAVGAATGIRSGYERPSY